MNKNLCDYTECDLLVLTTLITKEIARVIKDTDTLSMIGDLMSSIGDNVTLLAGRRERCTKSTS